MDRKVYNCLFAVQSLLYPRSCVLCGGKGAAERELCAACEADLPRIKRPCPRCGEPLPLGAPDLVPCGACQKEPPPFDACRAALSYAWPVPTLVADLKFRGRLATGRLLAELMGDTLEAEGAERPGLILPVPLHPARQRERGFNQALEIARPLAKRLGAPVVPGLCRRTRPTRPQTELERRARKRNVRGAFHLVHPPGVDQVAVLDDVVTTGSTVGEIARLLKAAGAVRVEVWCAARAVTGLP